MEIGENLCIKDKHIKTDGQGGGDEYAKASVQINHCHIKKRKSKLNISLETKHKCTNTSVGPRALPPCTHQLEVVA